LNRRVVLPKRPLDIRHELPGIACRPLSLRGMYPHVTEGKMVMEENTPPDVAQNMDTDDVELPAEQVVVAYHERTKHHYHRYAASLGYLDWAKQPDPFRRYDGAPLVVFLYPRKGGHFRSGSSMSRTTWCRLRFRRTPYNSSCDTHSRSQPGSSSKEQDGRCVPIRRAGTSAPQAYSRSVELRFCSGIDGSQKPAIITGKREWFKKYQPSRSK
jgi:hypothetical protein